MIHRSILFSLAFFFLLLYPVHALDNNTATSIVVEIIDMVPEVEAGGTARFTLAITNVGNERDAFKVTGDPYDVKPFSDFVQMVVVDQGEIKLDPGERDEVNVEIKILDDAPADQDFKTDLIVASLTHPDDVTRISAKVFVLPKNEIVQASIRAPTQVMPGANFEFAIFLKNKLNADLKNYELSVYSELPDISRSFFTNFTAREEREQEFSIPISLGAKPGDYGLNVRIYDGSILKGTSTAAFKVLEKSVIDEKKSEKGGFLKSETQIVKRNNGNAPSTQKIVVESSFAKNIFTSTTPEAVHENGDLSWAFTIGPGEEYTVTVVRNYRSLFYGFLIIVAVVIALYFYIDRSIVIKKRILNLKSGTEGISEIKILLIVRNGKMTGLDNVKVIDILPNILQPTYEFGTLKADKVQQGARGKRFVWELGRLEAREERVLTYKVKTKIHLAGEAHLPPALLQYTINGSTAIVTSDRLAVAPKPIDEY